MEQIVIHKITLEEMERIKSFIESLAPHYNESDISQMKKDLEIQEGYVAVEGKTILGFVLYTKVSDNIWEISHLGIGLNDLEHSAATILLRRLERECRKKLVTKIQATTKSDDVISEKDLIVRQFYRGYGFRNKEIKEKDTLILEKGIF